MAANVYKKWVQALGNGDSDWLVDTIKCILVDLADYTPNYATHEFLSSVPAGARVATSPALAGKTNTDGVLDANDTTFTSVTGDVCEMLLVYTDTGVDATSRLMFAFDDAATATPGLPLTPDGGNVNVTWSNGAGKIVNLDA